MRGGSGPRFGERSRAPLDVFVTTRVDSAGTDLPEVQVSIPYRSLIFRRENDTYVSKVLVAVVATAGNQRVGGGIGSSAAQVADYAATQLQRRLRCNVPVRLSGQDEVVLDVTIEVAETSRRWQRRLVYRPQAGRLIPLYFSGFQWNLDREDQSDQYLGIGTDSLRVELDLRLRPGAEPWPEGGVYLVTGIRGEGREQALVRRVPLSKERIQADGTKLSLVWAARDLVFGSSVLAVRLEGVLAEGTEQLALDPPRPFVNLQVPWWDNRDWKQHVSWLEGLVEKAQRQSLVSTGRGRRASVWRDVWEGLAASTGQAAGRLESQHLLRIVEADAKFGNFSRGALTARGRIFIRYGAPDSIRSHGDDLSRGSRWEIWYYLDERLQFTFYDPHGLGDFQLYDSSPL